LRCDLKAYGRIPTPGRDRTRLPAFDANDVASLRSRFHVRFVVVDHTKLGPDCKGAELALPVLRGYTPLGGDARYEVIDLGRAAG
jgi:hypothetical protein